MKYGKIIGASTIGFIVGIVSSTYFSSNSTVQLKQPKDHQIAKIPLETLPSCKPVTATNENDRFPNKPIDCSDELEHLSNRLETIEKELLRKNEKLASTLTSLAQLRSDAALAGIFVEDDQSPLISEKEAEELLPAPFSNVIAGDRGKRVAKDVRALHNASDDYGWGYEMENKIKYFVVQHRLSNGINLNSVICKSAICEVRGFEENNKLWRHLLNDMQLEEWWQFSSTSSTSSQSEEFGHFFYALASRDPTLTPHTNE